MPTLPRQVAVLYGKPRPKGTPKPTDEVNTPWDPKLTGSTSPVSASVGCVSERMPQKKRQPTSSTGSSSRRSDAKAPPIGRLDTSSPAIVPPPRGLLGLVCNRSVHRDIASYPEDYVLLNVYDISDTCFWAAVNWVSTLNDLVLMGGVYHAGVQVYGREWSFNHTGNWGTGLMCNKPRNHPDHAYRYTVPICRTALTSAQVKEVMQRMVKEWQSDDYRLISRNCLHFCRALCHEFGRGRYPDWIDRVGRTAAFIHGTLSKAASFARKIVFFAQKVVVR